MRFWDIKKQLKECGPIKKGILLMGLASLTVFIYHATTDTPTDLQKTAGSAYIQFDLDTASGAFDLVVMAPLREEIKYRGPVWIIILLTALLAWRFYQKERVIKVTGQVIAYLLLVYLTFVWASMHIFYPLTVFSYGLVYGYMVIKTKNLLYAIIFHSGANAIAVIGLYCWRYFSASA